MTKKQKYVSVFDRVPLVPVTHFEKLHISMGDAWHLVSPTIKRNMQKSNAQQLYCIALIEGMRMASFALMEKLSALEGEE
jgi:hypothetical protein